MGTQRKNLISRVKLNDMKHINHQILNIDKISQLNGKKTLWKYISLYRKYDAMNNVIFVQAYSLSNHDKIVIYKSIAWRHLPTRMVSTYEFIC